MIRIVLPAVALSLFAGCVLPEPRNEPDYQIGLTGPRQTRVEAERAHAARPLPQTAPNAQNDSSPRVLSSHFPAYPQNLIRAGVEGRVVVLFTVEPDGSVSDTAVQGSAPPELAALSLEAIRRWKFAPAVKNGVPIRARMQQPFLFKTE